MATRKASEGTPEISIMEIQRGILDVCILGTSPIILHCMSEKAGQELLFPSPKKTSADKQSTLKHRPIEEFRASPYFMEDEDAPTHLALLPSMFKRALGTAALDMPGSNKSQIGRLVYVRGERTPLWGMPRVFMSIVRNSDIARTPDVRTRAILPEWACRLTIEFTMPILRQQSIINLLAAAGMVSGAGDWRQEKGSGSYGAFKLVAPDDPDFVRITKTMGRAAQVGAMENPIAYNTETSKMLAWFDVELHRRGFTGDGRRGEPKEATAPAKRTRAPRAPAAEPASAPLSFLPTPRPRGRKPNGSADDSILGRHER
jgi:hypothetical protein